MFQIAGKEALRVACAPIAREGTGHDGSLLPLFRAALKCLTAFEHLKVWLSEPTWKAAPIDEIACEDTAAGNGATRAVERLGHFGLGVLPSLEGSKVCAR